MLAVTSICMQLIYYPLNDYSSTRIQELLIRGSRTGPYLFHEAKFASIAKSRIINKGK